jgi:hypothetical protein
LVVEAGSESVFVPASRSILVEIQKYIKDSKVTVEVATYRPFCMLRFRRQRIGLKLLGIDLEENGPLLDLVALLERPLQERALGVGRVAALGAGAENQG